MKSTKRGPLAAILAAVLAVTVCGCASTNGANSVPNETPNEALLKDPLLYEADGYTVALPREWEGRILIDVEKLGERELISVYEKESYEQSIADHGDIGAGHIFSFAVYDQAAYERYLCTEGTGTRIFAKDENSYYAEWYDTDVQYYRSDEEFLYEGEGWWWAWLTMKAEVEDIKRDFTARNGLQPFDTSEFFDREFTYDGEHRYVVFYPYHDYPDIALQSGFTWEEAGETLLLSQPAKQGEGGIWCVERWFDNKWPNWYITFPFRSGMTAADYYQMLQSKADAGEDTAYLTPEGAAMAWVAEERQETGMTFSPESFRLLDDAAPAQPYGCARKLVMQPGRFGRVSGGELIHTGDCPDGVIDGLYWSLSQVLWAELEGVSVDEEDFVYYETENRERLEFYNSGIVMIKQEESTKICEPMIWDDDNGTVYDEAVCWVTDLTSRTREEIEAAKDTLRRAFAEKYAGCSLERVFYNPSSWQSNAVRYAEDQGLDPRNAICILADFRTPETLSDDLAVLAPNSYYTWHSFILIRDTPESPWEIADVGN